MIILKLVSLTRVQDPERENVGHFHEIIFYFLQYFLLKTILFETRWSTKHLSHLGFQEIDYELSFDITFEAEDII